MDKIEVLEKFNHINENYQSAMIYYNLFKQLSNTVIKDYGVEKAENNTKIRNFYGWILGKNTEIAFLNMAIVQIFSIVNDNGDDKYGIMHLLKDLYRVKIITGEEKKKFTKYINYLNSADFRGIRHSIAHSFFNKDINSMPIDVISLDENIIGFGKILNDINLRLNDAQYYYEGFEEGIKQDYNDLLEDLLFSYDIRSYYTKDGSGGKDNQYFIYKCRKYCNLPI